MSDDIGKWVMGPNCRQLAIKYATRNVRSIHDGLELIRGLANPETNAMREAAILARDAINSVRNAPGGEQYGTTDEEIAGAILAEIEKRKEQQ